MFGNNSASEILIARNSANISLADIKKRLDELQNQPPRIQIAGEIIAEDLTDLTGLPNPKRSED